MATPTMRSRPRLKKGRSHSFDSDVSERYAAELKEHIATMTEEERSQGRNPHKCRHAGNCAKHALKAFLKSFALSYGLRSCLSLFSRVFFLLRTNPRKLFSLSQLVDEKHLVTRGPAVRLGLFTGGAAGIFEILSCLFRRTKLLKPHHVTMLAGLFSGLSCVALDKESRRTFALYMFARTIQCTYNAFKAWQWISPIPHGDALLFTITSAQVMYCYVMRPELLPTSYNKFIIATGPVEPKVLGAVRAMNRGHRIDLDTIRSYQIQESIHRQLPIKLIDTANPAVLGCDVIHPMEASCTANAVRVWMKAAKAVFPLYASLTYIPIVVFRFRNFIKEPLQQLFRGALSLGRSITFMASFVSMYQQLICFHRKVATIDHRFVYFLAGLYSSMAIFFERKSKRSELALYVMPRAADALFMQLCDRRWFKALPHGEVLLFCLSMSGLMYYYKHEPQTMAPLLHFLLGHATNQVHRIRKRKPVNETRGIRHPADSANAKKILVELAKKPLRPTS